MPALKGSDRRKFERLPLAIPVFVRGLDPSGQEFIEFATALDISCGGALLAIQRHLPPGSRIMLEIPSVPNIHQPTPSPKKQQLSARLVRVTNGDHCKLLGLKFSRPLTGTAAKKKPRKKKTLSMV
jgi:hypothetical protein